VNAWWKPRQFPDRRAGKCRHRFLSNGAADHVANGQRGCPLRFTSRKAASVSAVSPLCVMAQNSVSRSIGGLRTQFAAIPPPPDAGEFFIKCSPTSAACQLVRRP